MTKSLCGIVLKDKGETELKDTELLHLNYKTLSSKQSILRKAPYSML